MQPAVSHLANSGPDSFNRGVKWLARYLANLSTGNLILWCYAIWYSVGLVRYFDASARLWLTSLGVGIIVANALYISTTVGKKNSVKLDFWQIFRFFLVPFSVSGFSALVKGHGFILIFSPKLAENLIAAGLCVSLCLAVFVLKRFSRHGDVETAPSTEKIAP